MKENNILRLIAYVASIAFYIVGIVIIYSFLFDLNYYYLFVTIPLLFLLVTLSIVNFIKIILTIISMIFGRNDNNEVNNSIRKWTSFVNRICKYVLIGIFAALLTSIMALDVIICIQKSLYILVSLSIVVWIVLYYLLFRVVVKMIKKEIRL